MWLPAVNLNMQRSVKSSYGVTFLHFEMCWRKIFKQPVNLCGNMGIILWPAELWIQGCILALSAINFLWCRPCCFSIDWWANSSCSYSFFYFSAVIPFASLSFSLYFLSPSCTLPFFVRMLFYSKVRVFQARLWTIKAVVLQRWLI